LKVLSRKYLFLADDSVILEDELGEQPVEQPGVQGTPFVCRGYGDSLATVQLLATQSGYCPEAVALR
jgi:hypothetical protein